jgi:hypothetical protein
MLSQKAWDSAQRVGSTRHIENIRAGSDVCTDGWDDECLETVSAHWNCYSSISHLWSQGNADHCRMKVSKKL